MKLTKEILWDDNFINKFTNLRTSFLIFLTRILIDTKEKYTCDKCHTTFKVNAKMQFYASFDKVSNFDEEYTMSTHKDVFHLDEEAE